MVILSVALIFRNEAHNLPAWLNSVRPVADEIIALGSESADNGPAILEQAGARVIHQPWLGYGAQRNQAASFCTGQWVLFLDADERLDKNLQDFLIAFKQNPLPDINGFEFNYKVFFFGKFLRHGGFFPERHVRMVRKGFGFWSEREVHEDLQISGKIKRIEQGFVEHYSYNTIGEYLHRLDIYSRQAAELMLKQNRKTTPFRAWSRGAFAFFKRYFLRLGFLDGFAGYQAARLEGLYTFTKYARLMEMQKGWEDKK